MHKSILIKKAKSRTIGCSSFKILEEFELNGNIMNAPKTK